MNKKTKLQQAKEVVQQWLERNGKELPSGIKYWKREYLLSFIKELDDLNLIEEVEKILEVEKTSITEVKPEPIPIGTVDLETAETETDETNKTEERPTSTRRKLSFTKIFWGLIVTFVIGGLLAGPKPADRIGLICQLLILATTVFSLWWISKRRDDTEAKEKIFDKALERVREESETERRNFFAKSIAFVKQALKLVADSLKEEPGSAMVILVLFWTCLHMIHSADGTGFAMFRFNKEPNWLAVVSAPTINALGCFMVVKNRSRIKKWVGYIALLYLILFPIGLVERIGREIVNNKSLYTIVSIFAIGISAWLLSTRGKRTRSIAIAILIIAVLVLATAIIGGPAPMHTRY